MINIEKIEVYGMEAAIRGMRNPKNSWDKSDSHHVTYCVDGYTTIPCSKCECRDYCSEYNTFSIGDNDLKLAKLLANAGTDHGKFLRMITVYMDITAPLYWWKEYDTYKVGTVANSCSTMHKIADKVFTLDDFSFEHVLASNTNLVTYLIDTLNVHRELFLETKDKTYWWQMIQLLPSSYNQKRTVMLNYAVLKNIYNARKHHKLDEWQHFCKIVACLPYSELITGDEANETKS